MLQIFPCLICNVQSIKLHRHLQRNENCKHGYFNIFQSQNIEDICSRVTKLKKRSYNSRQSKERKSEYQKILENQKKFVENENYYINLYRSNTTFSNIYKCIICKLNLPYRKVRKLKGLELSNYAINPLDRRQGMYYLCYFCEMNKGKKQQEAEIEPDSDILTEIKEEENGVTYLIYHRDHVLENVDENQDQETNVSNNSVAHGALINNTLSQQTNDLNASDALGALINLIPSQQTNDLNASNALGALIDNIPSQQTYDHNNSVILDNNILSLHTNNTSVHASILNEEIQIGTNEELLDSVSSENSDLLTQENCFVGNSRTNSFLPVAEEYNRQQLLNSPLDETLWNNENIVMHSTFNEAVTDSDPDRHNNEISRDNENSFAFSTQTVSRIEANYFQDNNDGRILRQNGSHRFFLISIPTSHRVKSLFPINFIPRKYDVPNLLYRGDFFSEDRILKIYSNYLAKYFSCLYKIYGKISDNHNRTIQTSTYTSDYGVFGSDKYTESFSKELRHKLDHNGQLCIQITITYPLDNSETIASYLIQKNYVVTQNLTGDEENYQERKFLIHNHLSDVSCSENCPTISLENFLTERLDFNILKDDIIPTYLMDCVKKAKEFIARIIKCPISLLESEEFSLQSQFKENGEIQFMFVIWPKFFEKFNKMFADFSYGLQWNEDVEKELLMKLEKEIITRTDAEFFEENISLPPMSANFISELSLAKQLHFDPCNLCQDIQLPSTFSLISKLHMTPENKSPSRRLVTILKQRLKLLDNFTKGSLSVEDWLNRISDETQVVSHNCSYELTISNETLIFSQDDSLLKLLRENEVNKPFLAFYQYILMFGDLYQIYLKKTFLKEVFTHPYTVLYLKTASSTIKVMPIIGIQEWNKQSMPTNLTSKMSTSHNLKYHRIMSLSEAIFCLDGRMVLIPNSQRTQYVSLMYSEQFPVKKCNESELSYTEENENQHYEEIVTLKKKFFNRINANFITLIEFLSWYDEVKTDSIEIFSAYKNNLDNIDVSERMNIDGSEHLPMYILISSGHVVALSKKRKVLIFNSKDFKEECINKSNHLLFSKYLKSERINTEHVNSLINRLSENPDIQINVIQQRIRAFFIYKLN